MNLAAKIDTQPAKLGADCEDRRARFNQVVKDQNTPAIVVKPSSP
jgi:hypothetical protein